jgi:acetyl esterase/lipase/predicted alpha/beta superfamily hydrolase
MKTTIAALLCVAVLLSLCGCNASGSGSTAQDPQVPDTVKEGASTVAHVSADTSVLDVVNNPAFDGFGRFLFPTEGGLPNDGLTLANIGSLLPYHTNIKTDATVSVINYLLDEVAAGETVFYDIYTDAQKQADPSKQNTGLFFFRGKPDAPFAIACAGGGFSYVGSIHESFPLALELSRRGYNAFAIQYRTGGEDVACEDLAAALSFIFENAESLGVSTDDYSLWGGSAGARMAAYLGSYGTKNYGDDDVPKPATVVMQYTGHSDYTEDDPPTFVCIGENDGIASPETMEQRVNALKAAGIDTEYHLYPNLGHGFGLGVGTSAEGWVDDATRFWERHMTKATPIIASQSIPPELAAIPEAYYQTARQQGTLVELTYDTYESKTYEQESMGLTKRAIVYLPYGYSKEHDYNVFYLMHGGWGNETSTLGTPENPNPFKNVIDNSIANGEIEPLIIVCPTYNNTSPDDSGSFSLALELNRNYHNELINDLMPAVESTYSTYAEEFSPEGLMESRDHRGFGGFSMGSVATWRTFQYGLDYFRYFLPMSCGTSLDEDNIFAAAENHSQSDYFVWVITGTEDFAYQYDEDRVKQMRSSPYFIESDDAQSGNFAYRAKEGYSHDGLAAMEYTYNGLLWFWN